MATTTRAFVTASRASRAGAFDAITQWFGGKTSSAASSSPLDALLARALTKDAGAFSIDAYVDLLERAHAERGAGAVEEGGARHAAEVSFDTTRARAYATAMRESEREDPSTLNAARVKAIARDVPNGTHAEVSELLKTYALTRAMMQRARESFMGASAGRGDAAGRATPTTPEEFTRVITEHDRSMTREDRQNEARLMRGAYPGNRPCPCGSQKKFKRCCGG